MAEALARARQPPPPEVAVVEPAPITSSDAVAQAALDAAKSAQEAATLWAAQEAERNDQLNDQTVVPPELIYDVDGLAELERELQEASEDVSNENESPVSLSEAERTQQQLEAEGWEVVDEPDPPVPFIFILIKDFKGSV